MSAKIDNRNGDIVNVVDENIINEHIEYAKAVCEKAVERMVEGVIVASPFGEACKFCKFSALCGVDGDKKRTIGKVSEQTISLSLKGDGADGVN